MDEPARQRHNDHLDGLPRELSALAERYTAQPMPRPAPEVTARLVERLLAVQDAPVGVETRWRWRPSRSLRVARWRLRLLGPAFWCAGVALLALAGAFTVNAPRQEAALPLVLVGPLTLVLGLAHALRTTSRGLRDVEASAPVSFAEVSAGLALALVAFDGLLCGAVSVGLALWRLAPFATLVAAWLGPLLLLAGISLPVALRWGTRAGALVGGGPWLLLALYSLLVPQTPVAALFAVPGDAGAVAARLLAGIAGLALLVWPLLRGGGWRATALDGATAV